MEIGTLERFNTWWRTGKVREDLLLEYRRHLFTDIMKYMKMRQVLLIYGLRRVGKSTMMYQIINSLLEAVEPNRVLYFSFDERKYELEDLLETYQKMILHSTFEDVRGNVYIFFDEIQKIDDWESKIKVVYDLYPNVKFILSGSASIALRKSAKESLAGRIFDFLLEPLHFAEFLEMWGVDVSKIKANPDLWSRKLLPQFNKYLKFGMFPELVGVDDEEMARKYIIDDIVEKILYKDLPEAFGMTDTELLKSLIDLVSRNPGMLVDYASLSRNLKKDQRTIANYFEYLEFGMLIKFVFNYRGSPLASRRKLKKAYLQTPNIAFASGESIDRLMPKMLENIVMLASGAEFFYRNSFEVDFITQRKGELTGIEVKSSSSAAKQLMKLKKEFGRKVKGLLLLTEKGESSARGVGAIPIWRYCLFGK